MYIKVPVHTFDRAGWFVIKLLWQIKSQTLSVLGPIIKILWKCPENLFITFWFILLTHKQTNASCQINSSIGRGPKPRVFCASLGKNWESFCIRINKSCFNYILRVINKAYRWGFTCVCIYIGHSGNGVCKNDLYLLSEHHLDIDAYMKFPR